MNDQRKTDAEIKESIHDALWKDDFLRALDYYEIDVLVKKAIVYLNGHIVNSTSQSRVRKALRGIPGILEIKDNLVLDDELTLKVAASLGNLEHTYNCKFFTGVSHGLVLLSGIVHNENIKLLAEKCASSNPNVRGVMNNVRISNAELASKDQPFLQPIVGEIIYFLDGISGVVKQVTINPNNRRVTAMIIEGKFTQQQYALNSETNSKTLLGEQLIWVPISAVRFLTKVSGFLNIHSIDRDQYRNFNPGNFSAPPEDWVPPYPYCLDDVLFSIEYQSADLKLTYEPRQQLLAETVDEASFRKKYFANDSLGG